MPNSLTEIPAMTWHKAVYATVWGDKPDDPLTTSYNSAEKVSYFGQPGEMVVYTDEERHFTVVTADDRASLHAPVTTQTVLVKFTGSKSDCAGAIVRVRINNGTATKTTSIRFNRVG